MPQYVGINEDGERSVDDRLTLVLNDAENRFWPVIAKMSLDEAESLPKRLAEVIALKRGAAETPRPRRKRVALRWGPGEATR